MGRIAEAEDFVTTRLIRMFNATLAPHLAPVAAKDDAPLALHWCLAPEMVATGDLGPDGHAAHGSFLPELGLPRRMWAGSTVDFIAPLRVNDRVTKRSTIANIEKKSGRSGPFALVSLVHDYSTARGPALREVQDLVFLDNSPRKAEAKTAPGGHDLQWSILASETLLFRYSAITFNTHRIHYDLDYARGTENLPGLLVHGPLQATILTHLAATLAGASPKRMAYRATAPLFAGTSCTVAARRTEDGVACWIADAQDRVTMTAQAEFTEGQKE